jgi:pSer/pThr/pTyr-binding forkhead associated (FHA) protein/Mg-chelatase subunit ChlD
MDKIPRFILKIALLSVCVSLYAEPEVANVNMTEPDIEAIETGLDEELLFEAQEEPLIEELESEIQEVTDDLVLDTEAIVEDVADDSFLTGDLASSELSKDVVLVLDNSGSMKKNDPEFLVNQAVKEFISQQDENTRVAVVIFDQGVRLPVPLTDASISNRETILNSIENVNYKGLFTDSPAGIERAIYELKNNGRADAEKSIIFMTDGIVDTGEPARDLEKSKWLREDLAPDAADNEIKIFGIAFTEAADFQLIQSISQKTDGEYYRALTVEDLHGVFEQINTIINTPPEPEPVPVVIGTEPVEQAVMPVEPPAPVIIEVPVQTMGEEERIRSIIIIAAAIVLTLTLLAILILLLRRNRELKAGGDPIAQEAYINDMQGKTDNQTHKLGTKPTMFGRVAGKDTDHLDYIVVNESTIGRRHALIEFKDYSYWIIDQGSINGTFVNGEPVTSEVRLKHGDRIRLHKCEFEFIMPEMEDSGMTVISNTVFAAQPAMDDSEEATVMREHDSSEDATEIRDSDGNDMEAAAGDMDFDITGTASADELSDLYEPDPDEEDTIIRDLPSEEPETLEPEFTLDSDDVDSEDETIMLDDSDSDDDDDATLRKDDV